MYLSTHSLFRSQLLLCGTGEYSVADLRAHHIANGSSPEFLRVLDWFWTAVSNFTQEEMARLLQFTTGCSQLPPGGFQQLSPRFQITAAPTFANLPTAHTWYTFSFGEYFPTTLIRCHYLHYLHYEFNVNVFLQLQSTLLA